MITVSLGTTTPGVTRMPPWVTTSYRSAPFSTLAPGPITLKQQPSSILNTPAGIQSHVGEFTAGVVGGVFGAALLLGIVLYLCLRKRNHRSGAMIGAAMADGYGQPLMGYDSGRQAVEGYYR
jgi:hypothetical protein